MKGFAITPVSIGRISIGGITEKNGKKLPVKNSYFSVTSNLWKDGSWVAHPVAQELGDKPTRIPVRVLFNRPQNNFRARYTAFDEKGRTLCVGDGDQAKRRDPKSETGVVDCACPGPDRCAFGLANRCKPYGRLIIGIEQTWHEDPLCGFTFRTTSWNSIRSLTARLSYLHALCGGIMAGMTCNLVLRSKSTSASMRQPVYYVDLETRGDLASAVAEARKFMEKTTASRLDWKALEEAVANGYDQSAFEETQEDGAEVVEEFYSETTSVQDQADQQQTLDGGNQANQQGVDIITMTEKEREALNRAIARLANIHDERSLDDAYAWASMRFSGNATALEEFSNAVNARREGLSQARAA